MSAPPCKESARLAPVIDTARCEGKSDCAEVCPYGVFDIRIVPADERAKLGTLSRFKLWVHGGKQAVATRATDCHGCGLCVTACPEHAITLRAVGA